MERRTFLKTAAAAGGFLVGGGLFTGATGCATTSGMKSHAGPTLDEMLEQRKPRLMWVGAHPDDECLVGSIFAKAGPKLGCPLYFLVLTHGDGGECLLPEGCHPDLATVRGTEMVEVARRYGAILQHEHYWNAPLPVESFPKRHEIARRWTDETGDPTIVIAKAIRDFRPDILVTFAPHHGFTGHPEHQIASRFATAGVRLAADTRADLPADPYRVDAVYFGLNRYWITSVAGSSDPFLPTEIFNTRQACVDDKTCIQVMAENTKPHRTQAGDMGAVRVLSRMLINSYLYRTDPFTEIYDPYEAVDRGGMV